MVDEILENEKRWLLEEKYKGIKTDDYFSDVQKLKSGYPVAYLIGNVDFLGCLIDLHYKPLIPRPETELWVQEIIEEHKGKDIDVLDLFSGSGCIGISVLKNIEHPKVDFGELNPEFVDQIEKNIKINFLEKTNHNVYRTDVFSEIPKENKYDLILTNPPYIDKDKMNTVQNSVSDNEDHASLFAEDQGLFFVKKIVDEGFAYLKDKGKIYIEYDPWQTELIEEYLNGKGIIKYSFWKDQFGKNRVVIIEK